MKIALLIFLFAISLNCFTQVQNQSKDSPDTKAKADPEAAVTYGEGNNTFKVTPQMLSRLLMKNLTVGLAEATFPRWHASSVSKYPAADGAIHEKRYTLGTISHGVKVEFDSKRNVKKISITDFSRMEIKSFEQSLVSFGFRINASSSDLANTINQGVGGIREFYSKKGSPISFVLTHNQITVFKSEE